MDLLNIFTQGNGPWRSLTRKLQEKQTSGWAEPSCFFAAGVVVFRHVEEKDLLNTEVLTLVNNVAEAKGKTQIHFGGFSNPCHDYISPVITALRELYEESGYIPKMSIEDVLKLPELAYIHMPVNAKVRLNGHRVCMKNQSNPRALHPQPVAFPVFALDADAILMHSAGQLDQEVCDIEWQTLGNLINNWGASKEFFFPQILFGVAHWLATRQRFVAHNLPGHTFTVDLG